MQVHNIDTVVHPGQTAPCPSSHFATTEPWHWLPVSTLQNFEPVGHQFAALGIDFEDAIALCPSNPWFGLADCDVAIIPTDSHSLKLHLSQSLTRVKLGVVGSTRVTLSALDAEGHCLAIAHTVPADPAAIPPYPEQILEMDIQGATQIRIDAKAPFVVNRLAFR